MLIFPLKKEWYDKIKNGEKKIEYREVKPYWTSRLSKVFDMDGSMDVGDSIDSSHFPRPCVLQLGYNPKTCLSAVIPKIEIVNGKYTDLHIDKPVYAIHLKNVKETT